MRMFRKTMSIIYAILLLRASFVLITEFYAFLLRAIHNDRIVIIGGPDIGMAPTCIMIGLYLLSIIGFGVVNMIFAFKENTRVKTSLLLILWLIANTVIIKILPVNTEFLPLIFAIDYIYPENFIFKGSLVWRILMLIIKVLIFISLIPFQKGKNKIQQEN